jgi:fatty-acyl-CoA synthase
MASTPCTATTVTQALEALKDVQDRGFTFATPAGERVIPFAELHGTVGRVAASIRAAGVDVGARVALVLPEPDQFVIAFLACIAAGAVPVPMFPPVSMRATTAYEATLSHICATAGVTMCIASEASTACVGRALPSTERRLMSELLAEAPAGPLFRPAQPSDVAFLQFTSGSTAQPRGVVVTHQNLAANATAFMFHGLGADPDFDKGVSWLPLYHDMGLIGFVIGPLFYGIPVVFLPTATFVRSPRSWLEAISRHRGTITYAPNFAYQLVARRVAASDLTGLDLSCLKHAGCGAEPISADTLRAFATALAPAGFSPKAFIPSYGLAESTLAVAFDTRHEGLGTDRVQDVALEQGRAEPGEGRELVACGRAFPGHEIGIFDPETGARVNDRMVGEIRLKGPSVCAGYYGDRALSAGLFEGAWLRTGDLGYLVDGQLFVCGRMKEMIIVRGRNFFPTDLEWALADAGLKRPSVAFGVTLAGVEQLAVCVEGTRREQAELKALVTQVLGDQMALTVGDVRVVPVGTLPRTSSGKLQRTRVRAMYNTDTLPAFTSDADPAAEAPLGA